MLIYCSRKNVRINNRELTAAPAHWMGFKHKLNLSIFTYKSLGHHNSLCGVQQPRTVAACGSVCHMLCVVLGQPYVKLRLMRE